MDGAVLGHLLQIVHRMERTPVLVGPRLEISLPLSTVRSMLSNAIDPELFNLSVTRNAGSRPLIGQVESDRFRMRLRTFRMNEFSLIGDLEAIPEGTRISCHYELSSLVFMPYIMILIAVIVFPIWQILSTVTRGAFSLNALADYVVAFPVFLCAGVMIWIAKFAKTSEQKELEKILLKTFDGYLLPGHFRSEG
jgi:hypothetical protein